MPVGQPALSAPAAQARLGDLLNQQKSGGSSALGGILPGQFASSGSTGNVAGLPQFCIRNDRKNLLEQIKQI